MAAHVEIVDQESVTNLDTSGILDSLSDNADSGLPRNFSGDSTILLGGNSIEYDAIRNCFFSGMGPFASDTTIVAVRKISTQRVTTRAKFAAFLAFTEAMKTKNSGDANVNYGWYSGSKEEIDDIVSYGFSSGEIKTFENDIESHGVGIHLFHHRCSLDA